MAKQLIDNKINIVDTAGYIERTFIGEVKLWFLNLEKENIRTLRAPNDMEGKDIISALDILHKYEVAIRNELLEPVLWYVGLITN
ncbi:hypothetical protein L3H39_11015, partial [Corynebacterium sp. MC-16]|nr:hypothetical protein [Corynebacterium parakroppenstedtii]